MKWVDFLGVENKHKIKPTFFAADASFGSRGRKKWSCLFSSRVNAILNNKKQTILYIQEVNNITKYETVNGHTKTNW